MTHYYPATVDVHRNDPHWDYEEEEMPATEYTDQEPPAEVLSVRDCEGDIWSREGDRWFVSFRPTHAAFGNSGETPDDRRVYREWWDIQLYAPFTEAI